VRPPRRLLLLALLPALASAANEPPETLPSGRYDVGGHLLELACHGRPGPTTIVLDAGLGGDASDWRAVLDALPPEQPACTWQRAGYGGSMPGPPPRTSNRIAAELRTLLARAGVAPPYVVGGHSFGGFTARAFASLFPADVAGLVLVDPPHERQAGGVLEGALLGRIDPGGLLRGLWQAGDFTALLDGLGPFMPALGLDAPRVRAVVAELDAFPASAAEMRAATLPPALPVTVIAHGQRVLPPGPLGDRLEAEWLALLAEFACGHAAGSYRVALHSGHGVPFSEPGLVAAALLELVRDAAGVAARAGTGRATLTGCRH